MGNILDYLAETKECFEEKAFCAVDSLVLSQLSYLYFDGLVPGPGEGGPVPLRNLMADGALHSMLRGTRVPEWNEKLIRLLVENPRFAGLSLSGYVNLIDREKEEQFSATTFHMGEDAYVAYRGTDASYVAWKEDFNLAFICPVPSQVAGAEYLARAADHVSGRLIAGGHSKGGNLAVYSSLFCGPQAQEKLSAVFSHDGPGFQAGILESPEFSRIKGRIRKTIPQSSLVGILLQHQENYSVVKSGSFWIMQHDPYSWLVENGDFCYEERISQGSAFLDRSLNQWISSLSQEELSAFADALYQVLRSFGGETFNDLPPEWWKTALQVVNGMKGLDGDVYQCILHTVGALAALAVKNLPRPRAGFSLPDWKLPPIPLPRGILQGPLPPGGRGARRNVEKK